MENLDRTRLIEAYYRGTLKGIDKTHFKELMDNDPDFKDEVKGFKHIFKGLEALHVEQFQNRLMNMEAKYKNQTSGTEIKVETVHQNNIRPIKKFYAYAAAIALLVVASYAYYMVSFNTFDQYFQASQSIAVHIESTRGSSMPISEQLKKNSFTAYQQKDYKTCIELLDQYTNQYSDLAADDYQVALVKGVAQLASDQTDNAIKNLELVMKSRESSYRQEAEWMWALAQIKLNKMDAAKPVLEKIAKHKGHIHQDEAKALTSN